MTTTDAAPTPVRLLDRAHLPVVAGVLGLVTLAAFEVRAVQTVLPLVVRDLDGWGWFGAANGAALVAFTVAAAYSGRWTDRVGPRRVLAAGLALFLLAQVGAGLAPTMPVFVAARTLSGAAEALLDTALMVVVAQTLPTALRAKVFAGFAAAWVLPSLLGPGVAGGLEAVGGWRLVFVGPLAVALPALLLLRPALRRTRAEGASVPDPDARGRTVAALVLAAALGTATLSAPLLETPAHRAVGLAVVLGALGVAVGAAARALPRGTVRLAPGVPAVLGLRLLVAASFAGAGATIPLMLVTVHDASAALAGVSLSVTGVMWAVGSWVVSTDPVRAHLGPVSRTRVGGVLIAVGALGPALLALDVVGLVPGMAGWALAATGMGVLSPTLATELLAHAPAAAHGRVSAAQGLAVSTGVALQTGVVGAVVAWAGPGIDGPVFAALVASGALLAVPVALAAGRVGSPPGTPGAVGP